MISLHMQGGCLCENPPGPQARHDQRRNRRDDRATAPPDDLGDRGLDRRNTGIGIPGGPRGSTRSPAQRIGCTRSASTPNTITTRTAAKRCTTGWRAGCNTHRRPSIDRKSPSARIPSPICWFFTIERCLPRSVDAGQLTERWIDAAKRQLSMTPLAVRSAALRHALSLGTVERLDESPSESCHTADGSSGGRARSCVTASGRRLRGAPGRLQALRLGAAAGIRHFETYNRTISESTCRGYRRGGGSQPGRGARGRR